MNDDLDLDAIEARAKAASGGGEWNNRDLPHVVDMCTTRDVYAVVHRDVGDDARLPRVIAAHIAGMNPATTLVLVARVRALEDENKRMADTLADTQPPTG